MKKMSLFLQEVFEKIPEAERRRIMTEKRGSLSKSGTSIRMQFYLAKELYVTLDAFGAFTNSESDFFTNLVCEYIERKAMALGMMNVLNQK